MQPNGGDCEAIVANWRNILLFGGNITEIGDENAK